MFEIVSFCSMQHIPCNLACELQGTLVSACHLTREVEGTLYGLWESELNLSHALPFPESKPGPLRMNKKQPVWLEKKASDEKCEGTEIRNPFEA